MANSFTPLRTTPDGWTLTRDGWEPPEQPRTPSMTESLRTARDPFAPPTTCPVCYGQKPKCKVCHGTNVFVRAGIFRDHSCPRCRDGALPEYCPTKVRGACGEPMARND